MWKSRMQHLSQGPQVKAAVFAIRNVTLFQLTVFTVALLVSGRMLGAVLHMHPLSWWIVLLNLLFAVGVTWAICRYRRGRDRES